MNEKIKIIRELSNGISLLYVEDNVGLADNMSKLLSRMFDNVLVAHNGQQGYEEYLKSNPKIIITDVNMPNLNGFQMIKKIKALEPESKIIILSAYNEKKHLHIAINLGVFRYLHKPAKIPELVDALYDTVTNIHKTENSRIFFNQLQSIFNYQNNIIMMMHNKEFILANNRFNEFFGVDNLDDFMKSHDSLDELLLEHKEFLHTTPSASWCDIAVQNPGKLFHTKIMNHKGQKRHLILKLREVPEKNDHFILSFDDITELNLMALFDLDAAKDDAIYQDKMSVITLLQVVKDNSSEVKLHNFYKGLTIVNPAVVTEINDDEFTLKTVNAQLKIVQITKFMTICSEIFPKDVICKSIKKVDSDNQIIVINDMCFSPRSPNDRMFIRLQPDADHGCTLFYKNIKFVGETRIVDISEVSVKLAILTLPAGMAVDTKVKISINLKLKGRLLSFTTEATIYRIDKDRRNYNLVMLFELDKQSLTTLREYLVNRQIELIREFKSLDVKFNADSDTN